mgnify:CR=1 FL=1
MAIIGNIDGLPIYDTKEEALVWARHNRLTGYHTHDMNGKVGYMGGDNHSKAVQVLSKTTTSTSSSGY